MKRKLPEKFFEQNQRAKTRKWKFFNLSQALWGAGNREFRLYAISNKRGSSEAGRSAHDCSTSRLHRNEISELLQIN